ncbi:putative PEP-binding protein [Nocardia sp. NPDC051030]|uniref:putative PEP-binding protein n=1 Tax=Nocardia sp. NPDC051030 TaxID=3155162 RepID=UPI0034144DFB
MRISVALSGEQLESRVAAKFPGVGLLRGEYVFRRAGRYPTTESVEEYLVPYLRDVAEQAGGQPVWYRFLEVTTVEANVLAGVEEYIEGEAHPLLGMRGIRRARRFPAHFRAEIAGVAAVANAVPGNGIGVVLPFVTDPEEVEWAAAEIQRHAPGVAIGSMIETPSALLQLDRLIDAGVERALIGVNDLSSLVEARTRARGVPPSGGLMAAIALAREVTARRGIELAVAGYLSAELIDACRAAGVDECVVHYHDLPRLFGSEWDDLPELGLLTEIKEKTLRDIAARTARG